LVLLSICTALKTDLQCSAAELVYGTTLRLPGEFFQHDSTDAIEGPHTLLTRHKTAIRELRAVPVREQSQHNTYVSKDLATCTHVFVRNDAVRNSRTTSHSEYLAEEISTSPWSSTAGVTKFLSIALSKHTQNQAQSQAQ
jgi:hypothetical protein